MRTPSTVAGRMFFMAACTLLAGMLGGCKPSDGDGASRKRGGEEGLTVDQTAARVANIEGLKLSGFGNYIDALAQFERAVRLDEHPDYLNNLGRTLYWLGRNDTALRAFSRAVRLGKNDAEVLCNIADVHLRLGNELDAVEFYQRAIQAEPDHPRAQYALGDLYLKNGQLDDAEYRLNMAVRLAPDYDRAILSRMILYNLKGQENNMYFDRAYKDLQILERRGFEVNPDLKRRVLGGYLGKS